MRGVSGLRRKSRPSLIGVGKAAGLNGFGNDRDLEVVELGKLRSVTHSGTLMLSNRTGSTTSAVGAVTVSL